MNTWLTELLSGDPQTMSSMRFCVVFTVLLSNVALWYTWLFLCIWERQLINIPEGVVMAYAASQGLSLFGKGVQTFAERPSRTTSTYTRENKPYEPN